MDNIPNGLYLQDEDLHIVDRGGACPRPYPIRPGWQSQPLYRRRVRAGLAHLSRALVRRLLLAVLLIYAGCILFLMSSPPEVLAQGNTFVVTVMGPSQQPGFAPDLLTVHIYDTVVFVNSAASPIAITAADSSFSSPAIVPGKQWKVTFNSVGAFEYHDNGNPTPRIFGEIVVVPDMVGLLPSPAPAAQQTAIAYIQAGKTPPDTVWQQATLLAQTPVAVSPFQNRTTHSLPVPPLALLLSFARPVILVVMVLFMLFAAGLSGLWLYRRRSSHKKGDDDEDEEDRDDANE